MPGAIAASFGAAWLILGRRWLADELNGHAHHRRADAVRDVREAAREIESTYDAARATLSPYRSNGRDGEFALAAAAQESRYQRDMIDGLVHAAGFQKRIERERRRRLGGQSLRIAAVALCGVAAALSRPAAAACAAAVAALVVLLSWFAAVALERRLRGAVRALQRARPRRDLEQEFFEDVAHARRRSEVELGRWLRTARDGPAPACCRANLADEQSSFLSGARR